jgi:hypothetical protein
MSILGVTLSTGTVKTCKNCELGQNPGAREPVAEKGALWLALHGFIHPTPA